VKSGCVLLLLLLALQACGEAGPVRPQVHELEARESLWDSVGPESYEYAVQRLCFCPIEHIGPVRVRVENGVVVGREYVEGGLAVPEGVAPGFPAVDGLFELLRSAYEEDAHEIRVTYDPALGVPVDFWIDYVEMVADEELGMRVTEAVAPLP
jgi:hypothetical protein